MQNEWFLISQEYESGPFNWNQLKQVKNWIDGKLMGFFLICVLVKIDDSQSGNHEMKY